MTPKYAYMNGKIVPWTEARVHVFSPVVRYATAVFESIPGFFHTQRMNVFRLDDYLRRLNYSQKMMRFSGIDHDIREGIFEVIKIHSFQEDILIRPMIYLDGESPGGSIGTIGQGSLAITVFPMPQNRFIETGCNIQVSSWTRMSDNSMPARIKATANYQNSRLADLQSKQDGYDSCLLLNSRGYVSEGPGQCFAMIRDGVLITPDINSDILESITRDTILKLAKADGIMIEQRNITRSELYTADEAFYCGSTWSVTPIVGIDGLPVGSGRPGKLTSRLQELYRKATRGEINQEWSTLIK